MGNLFELWCKEVNFRMNMAQVFIMLILAGALIRWGLFRARAGEALRHWFYGAE